MQTTRRAKVYVPQVPSTFNVDAGVWVPKISISKAEPFGDVEVLLPPGANRAAVGQLAISMREKLKDALPGDYLLPTGDPALIAIASIYISRAIGFKINLLKWDNRAGVYIPMEINL